jgi:hypothetical protein
MGLIPLSINKTEQLKLEYSVICKPFLFEYKYANQQLVLGLSPVIHLSSAG